MFASKNVSFHIDKARKDWTRRTPGHPYGVTLAEAAAKLARTSGGGGNFGEPVWGETRGGGG